MLCRFFLFFLFGFRDHLVFSSFRMRFYSIFPFFPFFPFFLFAFSLGPWLAIFFRVVPRSIASFVPGGCGRASFFPFFPLWFSRPFVFFLFSYAFLQRFSFFSFFSSFSVRFLPGPLACVFF